MLQRVGIVQKVVIIGPSGVGKSQIFDNLVEMEDAVFLEDRKETIGVNFRRVKGDAQLWDTSGQKKFELITGAYVVGATFVLVTIDHQTLSRSDGGDVLSRFLKIAADKAPEAKVKIVVNKMDEIDKTAVTTIMGDCNKKISAATDLPGNFDLKKDVIYYSAKEQAKELSNGAPLRDDPIYTQLIESGIVPDIAPETGKHVVTEKPKVTRQPGGSSHKSFFPEIDWALGWQELKPKLIVLGKALLFLLIAAGLTVVFGAIGFGIGFAAGAWAGPGAFFTAIAGTFAGVVTASSLAVLIVAPLLGLAITGTGFGLWHREQAPPLDPTNQQAPPPRRVLSDLTSEDLDFSRRFDNPNDLYTSKQKQENPALGMPQGGQTVLGGTAPQGKEEASKLPQNEAGSGGDTGIDPLIQSITNDPKGPPQ